MWNDKTNSKIKLIKKIFLYQVVNENQKTSWKIRPYLKHILIILLLAFIIFVFAQYNYKINVFGSEVFLNNIKQLFKFDSTTSFPSPPVKQNNWLISLNYLWTTLKISFIGTFIGFIIALCTSFVCNKKTTNKYLAIFFNQIILLLRCIPELVFIQLWSLSFSGELALLLIYFWFSWLWLHKYFLDILHNFDESQINIWKMQGKNNFQILAKEIWPRIKQRFFGLFIYSFESNVRWASILGTLGVFGIGQLINYDSKYTTNWNQLGIPLLILVITLSVLEINNIILNKYIFKIPSKKKIINEHNEFYKYKNWRKTASWTFIIICFILTIFTFVYIDKSFIQRDLTTKFFKAWFNPEWSILNLRKYDCQINPFLLIINSLMFAFTSLIVSMIVIYFTLYLQISLLHKKLFYSSFRIINVIIRVIPSIVLIYLFNPIFVDILPIMIIIIGIQESSSINKQLFEAIDNLNATKFENLKMSGYSNFFIYRKFILPSIKKDIQKLMKFYFEMAFRNSITFSVLVGQSLGIGFNINRYLNPLLFQPNKAFTYIWIATLSLYVMNLLFEIKKVLFFNLISFHKKRFIFKIKLPKYRA